MSPLRPTMKDGGLSMSLGAGTAILSAGRFDMKDRTGPWGSPAGDIGLKINESS